MYMVMFCPLCVLCAVFVFVYYVVWCVPPCVCMYCVQFVCLPTAVWYVSCM